MNIMQELETSQCLSPGSALIESHGSHFALINFKLVFFPASPPLPPQVPFPNLTYVQSGKVQNVKLHLEFLSQGNLLYTCHTAIDR